MHFSNAVGLGCLGIRTTYRLEFFTINIPKKIVKRGAVDHPAQKVDLIMKWYSTFLLVLCCLLYSSRLSYAEVVYRQPPPVEKQKSKVKKQKKKKRFWRQKRQQDEYDMALGFFIGFTVMTVVGAFLLGLGFPVVLLWATGLALLFGGLAGISIVFFATYVDWLRWGGLAVSFVLGLIFLIAGLISFIPLFWISGIVLLGIALFFGWLLLIEAIVMGNVN